jgi:hypothetical protein
VSVSEHFVPIIPRHRRLLEKLREQLKVDEYGGMGWRGLMDEDEEFTIDQLFKPLMERGMVEDLSHTALGNAGIYFVRITRTGLKCLSLGVMPKDPRPTTELEIDKYITAPPADVVMQMIAPPTKEMRIRIVDGEVVK